MDISPVSIASKEGAIVYQVNFDLRGQAQQLWFEVSHFGNLSLSTNADTALVSLLLPAMLANENIHIAGSISEQLLFNLNGAYQTLVIQQIPQLNRIKISAEKTSSQSSRAKGVITGFSAGVDSFCTLTDYFTESTPSARKVTHLLYNNVGSHGKGKERLFKERYAQLKQSADNWQLPFIMVNSNMNDFYGRALDFQLTHTIRNAAIPMLLQEHIGHFLYSSAYSYKDLFVGSSYDMAYSDVFSLPLLSTESLQSHSVGSEYTRVEKTAVVAKNPESYKVLDVCVKGDQAENCSYCDKCLRTMLTLDMTNQLSLYKDCFDLAVYQQHKDAFIGGMLVSDDPLLKEIVVWAKQINYPFSFKHYVYVAIFTLKHLSKLSIKNAKKPVKYLLAKLGLYQPKQYH
ncbi:MULTISPECIES: hypothetical protein [unclassified Agarivorans]|uniref:hypothetical protein n=1 Tax=unclassified Agarivorans TaxID=2636026 RepID=UPI0026E41ABE|nr:MULTISPECIES: hypothetical protein [unclassified Agarivorans]MDO6687741.1 hypothetical protein [Agarivorans sp. 3_MG-2023]MDO6717258.1 hypothetical protein [Agarivorans sp. 2_MG-2023]